MARIGKRLGAGSAARTRIVSSTALLMVAALGLVGFTSQISEPAEKPPAKRELGTQIAGDVWVLAFAESASTRWKAIDMKVKAGPQTLNVQASKSGAWSVRGPAREATMTAAGTFAARDNVQKKALVFVGRVEPGASVEARRKRVADGFIFSRLPEEAPTNWDSANLALAPSYWIRTMVNRYATSVTVIGEESVAGRSAHKVKILFGGPAAQKYGVDGWSWWVDKATGLILRYELSSPDPLVAPDDFEITQISVDGAQPDTALNVPGGFDVTFRQMTSSGKNEKFLHLTAAKTAAALVAELAK